ncbi:MAG: hypothetical protein ACLSB9_31475 [Hydrogeniiclostridium mannosilyticum]
MRLVKLYAFECENDMVIVDCGMAFPDGDMLGVDLVLPDLPLWRETPTGSAAL